MPLTHHDIVTTGLRLLREYGLADLSMRRIAKELGVQPGALYWHVKNKQELLVTLARALTAINNDGDPHLPARPAPGTPPTSDHSEPPPTTGTLGASSAVRAPRPSPSTGTASNSDPSPSTGASSTDRAPGPSPSKVPASASRIVETAALLRAQLAGIPDGAEVVQLAYALDPDAVEPLVRLRLTLEKSDPQRAAAVTDAVAFLVFGELIAAQARELAGTANINSTDTTAVLELLAAQFESPIRFDHRSVT